VSKKGLTRSRSQLGGGGGRSYFLTFQGGGGEKDWTKRGKKGGANRIARITWQIGGVSGRQRKKSCTSKRKEGTSSRMWGGGGEKGTVGKFEGILQAVDEV